MQDVAECTLEKEAVENNDDAWYILRDCFKTVSKQMRFYVSPFILGPICEKSRFLSLTPHSSSTDILGWYHIWMVQSHIYNE